MSSRTSINLVCSIGLATACGDSTAENDDEIGNASETLDGEPGDLPGPSGSGCELGFAESPSLLEEPEELVQHGGPTLAVPRHPLSTREELRSTLIAEPAVFSTARNLAVSWCAANIEPSPLGPFGSVNEDLDAMNLESYEKLVDGLERAMRVWERHSRINFVHRVDLDDRRKRSGGMCQPEFDEIWFRAQTPGCDLTFVGQTNAGGLGEFDPEAGSVDNPEGYERILCIDRKHLEGAPSQIPDLTAHETGHLLGLDHEHLRFLQSDDAPNSCSKSSSPEPPIALTPPDPNSVMGYDQCDGSVLSAGITARDRLGSYYAFNWTNRRVHEMDDASFGRHAWSGESRTGILWYHPFGTQLTEWLSTAGPGDPLTFDVIDRCMDADCDYSDVFGHWRPIVGQFTGVALALDVFMHAPGDAEDVLLRNDGTEFKAIVASVPDRAIPVVGNFGSGVRDQILWYRPGPDSDELWAFDDDGSHDVQPVDQDGWRIPIVGHFRSMSSTADILWFDPVDGNFDTWVFDSQHEPTSTGIWSAELLGLTAGSEWVPLVGNFDGDARSDLFWYRPGAGGDHLWLSISAEPVVNFESTTFMVDGEYRAFVGDFDADGIDDIFWYRAPDERDGGLSRIWYFGAGPAVDVRSFAVTSDTTPYADDFDGDGCTDILWYSPLSDASELWRCLPQARDFGCEDSVPTPTLAYPIGLGGSY
jgi:hypothetical protein